MISRADGGRGAGAIPVLALALCAVAPLEGQEVQYTGSVGYATGSYTFTERTSSVSILNGLAVRDDGWSISASVPVVIQNSGDVTYVGGIRVPTGSGRGPGRGSTGGAMDSVAGGYEVVLGDPLLRGSLSPYRGFGFLRVIELQAMAKVPVADPSTGVGTGEWDVGGGVSAGFGFGRTFLFADASVWSPGDLPDLELKPYATGSLGLGLPVSDRWSTLVSATASSPVIDGIAAPVSLGGGLSYRAGEQRSVSAGATLGLTESAPDFSVYIGWSAAP